MRDLVSNERKQTNKQKQKKRPMIENVVNLTEYKEKKNR